ncbi:MAG: hypothetical protein ACM3VY_00275, partial [Candidatus Bathyarchaeota archaeon]
MAFGISAGTAALIGGGMALGGSLIAANAASDAADTQAQAATNAAGAQLQATRETNQLQKDIYDQNRADLAPWRDAGTTALSQLAALTGSGGEFNHKFGLSDFQADPGYQFTRQQGELAIDRANAAGGRYASGAAIKDLLNYNSGLANQTFNDSFNRYQTDQGNRFGRLASLAGIGQTATGQTVNAGQTMAGNVGANTMAGTAASNNALMSGAAARASGYVGGANAISGGLNNAAGMMMLSKLPMFGGGYGAG